MYNCIRGIIIRLVVTTNGDFSIDISVRKWVLVLSSSLNKFFQQVLLIFFYYMIYCNFDMELLIIVPFKKKNPINYLNFYLLYGHLRICYWVTTLLCIIMHVILLSYCYAQSRSSRMSSRISFLIQLNTPLASF